MDEQDIREKEYLLNVFLDKLPNDNPFIIKIGENKEMFVISPGKNAVGDILDKVSQYRDIYSTILDLRNKIGYSLEMAIEYAYSDEIRTNYNVIISSGSNEWLAYYFIENALFRIEAMWDILAQVYNIKYGLGKRIDRVYHKKIFSNNSNNECNCWKGNPPKEVQNIIDYIYESDDTSGQKWKGNYTFVSKLRNKMTHRYSISKTNMSSYAFEIKHPPVYILKRLCEEFSTLQDFIYETFENILEEYEDDNI